MNLQDKGKKQKKMKVKRAKNAKQVNKLKVQGYQRKLRSKTRYSFYGRKKMRLRRQMSKKQIKIKKTIDGEAI